MDCKSRKQRTCFSVERHGLFHHPLYSVWRGMRGRCNNESNASYKNYGGRGIEVCKEWNESFKTFYLWCVSNGWEKGLNIDRIDNDKGYNSNNCTFITVSENQSIGKKRILKSNKSGYVGVHKNEKLKTWIASIRIKGKRIHLGSFKIINDAIEARINGEVLYLGKQCTNFHYVSREQITVE